MSNVKRLINASKSEINKMGPLELKESIYKSEGRVIMGQHLIFAGPGTVMGVTNAELLCSFGADMVMLNTIDLDNFENNPGLCGLTIKELKEKCNCPIGVYLGCPKKGEKRSDEKTLYRLAGMFATKEHILKAVALGVDFIVLGGNPGSGTSIEDVIEATKLVKEICGDDIFLFAGKWEDGIEEKVLGDPLAAYDTKDVIKRLIDAGADCIDLPAPGTRAGITVDMIRELVEYIHRYKPGTLAMSFLNSSVECADEDTIRQVALLMKQTGCDIHAIGDGGFGGCTWPENLYQLSVSIKGKNYTWFRMASNSR